MTNAPVRWALTFAAFLIATVVAFVPVLFGLAETPLHDGREVPGGLLLGASGIASVGIGVLAAGLLHRRLRTSDAVSHRLHELAKRALLASASAAMGLAIASLSASSISAMDLDRRWGRVPAGCYELDHCGRSSWWMLGFLFVGWGLPAVAFAAAGWRAAAGASWLVRVRTALLLSVGVLAYHCACQSIFVLVAYR